MKRIVLLLLAALMLFTSCVAFAADGSSNIYQGYTYDFFRNIKSTPAPFVLSQVIDSTTVTKTGRTIETVTDIATSEDGWSLLQYFGDTQVYVRSDTLQPIK